MAPLVFHVELRQFPHVARVFNLTREELDARFTGPWASGTVITYDDRRWAPERARLTVYEGPELRTDELGMGRGWSTVGKTSREVTETVLTEAQRGAGSATVRAFTDILGAAATTPMRFSEVMVLAAGEHPHWRASEQMALAEQAVWEMLHRGRLILTRDGEPVPAAEWQPILLGWSTWSSGDDQAELRLKAS
jgi:hypothetical protein